MRKMCKEGEKLIGLGSGLTRERPAACRLSWSNSNQLHGNFGKAQTEFLTLQCSNQLLTF